MINWKEQYERTLKNICEADIKEFADAPIIEVDYPKSSTKWVHNENADVNAFFSFKLGDDATEADYKEFVEYVYERLGEDIHEMLGDEHKFTNFGKN